MYVYWQCGHHVRTYSFLFTGGGTLFYITKRAMVKKDNKELDEAIRSKILPFLYNNGQGKMVPIAQLTMLRNRDRSTRKQVIIMMRARPQ